MKAEIFYIEGEQEKQYDLISKYLIDIFDRYIDLTKYKFPLEYNYNSSSESHANMDRFIRLLRSSMIKYNDFEIVAKSKSGFNWWYLGSNKNQFTYNSNYNISLDSEQIRSMFPAIAMMNRLIILPSSINVLFDALEKESFKFLFKPIDLQGVTLMDFIDETRLQKALSLTKIMLNTEISKYCNRYIEIKNIQIPDYKTLAELLNIQEQYLTRYESDFFKTPIKITPKIISENIPVNKESIITIEIFKETDIEIGDLYVEIRAPYRTINNNTYKCKLQLLSDKKECVYIKLKIKPRTEPFCPLEIRFSFNDLLYESNPIPFPIPLLVPVG